MGRKTATAMVAVMPGIAPKTMPTETPAAASAIFRNMLSFACLSYGRVILKPLKNSSHSPTEKNTDTAMEITRPFTSTIGMA